jgi:hypothetical protein
MRFIIILALIFQTTEVYSQEETSVLFIGNSFTFTYDMPFKFKEIAESFGRKTYVDTVVKGGMNLKYHSDQAKTYEKIRSRKWDYIVIQGHSKEFARPTDSIDKNCLPFARKIVDSIRANHNCTKILFYETWGYKNGINSSPLISTYSLMQSVIEKEYLRFVGVFSAGLVPVGSVWREVRENYPLINLYNEDLYHPSKEGSYLAACTFYASIFRVSPVNNTAKSILSQDLRNSIELTATQIVINQFDKWSLKPESPELVLGYDLILQNNKLQINNRAENFNTISWSFGDGLTSLADSPKHIYEKSGKYTINQKIENGCNYKELSREIVVKKIR